MLICFCGPYCGLRYEGQQRFVKVDTDRIKHTVIEIEVVRLRECPRKIWWDGVM